MRLALLAAALALAPAAHAAARCGGVFHPCATINLVSEPAGAVLTAVDAWGRQDCTTPCSLALRAGASVRLVGSLDGYEALYPPIRWVYRWKMLGRSRYEIEPDPVTFRFERRP